MMNEAQMFLHIELQLIFLPVREIIFLLVDNFDVLADIFVDLLFWFSATKLFYTNQRRLCSINHSINIYFIHKLF